MIKPQNVITTFYFSQLLSLPIAPYSCPLQIFSPTHLTSQGSVLIIPRLSLLAFTSSSPLKKATTKP